MKILIVGAGGIGGYFGAKLITAGADITYLEKNNRHNFIQKNGLTIETPNETFTVQPKLVTIDHLKPIYDLIILTPKAFDLEDSLKDLSNATSKGILLPFLNGFSHLEKLDNQFGKERIMAGVAQIMAMVTPVGSVKRITRIHSLTIGPRSKDHETVAQRFFQLCQKADFDSFYNENIEQTLWDKWVLLASLASITTFFHSPVGKIAVTKYGRELTHHIYHECCAIAKACGFSIDTTTQNEALETLTKEESPLTASMLRDFEAGQKTEHEHILHDLIHRGIEAKVPCSLLKVAYTHISLLQDRRSKA